jgi:hypothetical protein
MTVPHLMNCPHSAEGWCLDCVVELGNENWRLRDVARDAAELARLRAAEADFHMEYRLKCDVENKAQAVQIERLRAALQEADNIMGHEDEHTAWRERWQTLWPWSGGPNAKVSR